MKVSKITIKQLKDGWSLSFGASPIKRTTARGIYRLLETRLMSRSALRDGHKTAVLVQTVDGCQNETIDSSDPHYLLWTASCFLEDYLLKDLLNRKDKKYGIK